MEEADRHVNYLADAVGKIVRGAYGDTAVGSPLPPPPPPPPPHTRSPVYAPLPNSPTPL